MIHPLLTAALGPLAFVASTAGANWMSGGELGRHCNAYLSDPETADAAVCAAFVHGYISGAGRRASRPWPDPDEDGFADRAARTRIGSRLRSLREERAERRTYCLGGAAPEAVVDAVAAHIAQAEPAADAPAERTVHRALVAEFPCNGP